MDDLPQTCGRLTMERTVVKQVGRKRPKNQTCVVAVCDCGVRTWIAITHWKYGTYQECGSCSRAANGVAGRDMSRANVDWMKGATNGT